MASSGQLKTNYINFVLGSNKYYTYSNKTERLTYTIVNVYFTIISTIVYNDYITCDIQSVYFDTSKIYSNYHIFDGFLSPLINKQLNSMQNFSILQGS